MFKSLLQKLNSPSKDAPSETHDTPLDQEVLAEVEHLDDHFEDHFEDDDATLQEQIQIKSSQYLTTLATELGQPLKGITVMAELMLNQNLIVSERKDYARTILSSANTLLRLVNDIQIMSTANKTNIQLEKSVFNMESILKDIVTTFSTTASEKNITLDSSWRGPAYQRYITDAPRIRHMLSTLVNHALISTHTGSVRIECMPHIKTMQYTVLYFSVTDTSDGLRPDQLEELTAQFNSPPTNTDAFTLFDQTGLSFSLLHNLVHTFGGTMGVESEWGRGSCFWFKIQVPNFGENINARKVARQESVTTTTHALKKLKGTVIIVDDSKSNALVLMTRLKRLGLNATCIYNSKTILETILSGYKPNMILMKMHMPAGDVFDIATKIRQYEECYNLDALPIITYTDILDEQEDNAAKALGIVHVITDTNVEKLQLVCSPFAQLDLNLDPKESVKEKAFDKKALSLLIDRINPMLAQNNFEAIACFQEIMTLVQRTEYNDTFKEIEDSIKMFRFDLVLTELNNLNEKLKDTTKN